MRTQHLRRIAARMLFREILLVLVFAFAGNKVKALTVSDNCDPEYLALSPTHTRCLVDDPQATEVILTQSEKDAIVNKHNQLRANVDPPAANMQKMVWDEELALTAGKWARQCLSEHDADDARREPDYPGTFISQNAAFGFSGFEDVIDAWYAEKENFIFGGPFVNGTGHFFQIVFDGSSRVGCAKATCSNTQFQVHRICNYAADVNNGRTPYIDGPSCSACLNNCDAETGSLCDCGGLICYRFGQVNVDTCTCDCVEGFKGAQCEERDCPNEDFLNKCSFLTPEDCGVEVSPENCPILCGLCPKPCDGKVCENGGTLNYDTCECQCSGDFTGALCENCPANDRSDCINYELSFCSSSVTVKYDCPYRCEVCQEADLGCQPCQNQGTLNPDDCSCFCQPGFTGNLCEICPPQDSFACETQPTEYCTLYPWAAAWMQANCPRKCGLC